jgi:hypothetical protein
MWPITRITILPTLVEPYSNRVAFFVKLVTQHFGNDLFNSSTAAPLWICELWSRRNVEGSGRGLIWGTHSAFAWKDWGEQQTLHSRQPVFGPRFEPSHLEYATGGITTVPLRSVKKCEESRYANNQVYSRTGVPGRISKIRFPDTDFSRADFVLWMSCLVALPL